MCAECDVSTWGQWLYDWQTLVSAVLALVAAGWTVRYLKRQIAGENVRHQELVQRDQKLWDRRSMRTKAYLPIALSDVCDYCEEAFIYLRHIRDSESGIQGNPVVPSRPAEALEQIRECIEYAEDRAARRLEDILREFQIARSRLEGAPRPLREDMVDHHFDHVHLRMLVDSLFEYARGDKPTFEEPQDLQEAYSSAMLSCNRNQRLLSPHGRTALMDYIAARANPESWEASRHSGLMELPE
ncbi:MAG: hypothetical protein DI607_12030 [Sphingomonas hengshuiensis]|nr:MAG: hypothetical protein DI607_12030 [Sphingomonas hengshuiensis]